MTITWVYGRSKSGKSTLARKIADTDNAILLDGDQMRNTICKDLGFSADDRRENNLRVARLARLLDGQGFNVVVATICPYRKLRHEVREITGCRFIYMEGGLDREDPPFEEACPPFTP